MRRVPVRLQMSVTECGAACLAMVLSAHGRHTGVAECRERLGIGRDGATGTQIADAARQLGMTVRAVSLDLDHLGELRTPAILHWNFSHYVVLERWTGTRARLVDPGAGRVVLSREEFSDHFTGVALEMTPG